MLLPVPRPSDAAAPAVDLSSREYLKLLVGIEKRQTLNRMQTLEIARFSDGSFSAVLHRSLIIVQMTAPPPTSP